MNKWINWCVIKNLSESLDDPGLIGDIKYSDTLCKFIPRDGTPINFNDPALRHFFDLFGIDFESKYTPTNQIFSRPNNWFSITIKSEGPADYESPEMDRLFELKNEENGWNEIDRILKSFGGLSLSGAEDLVNKTVILHKDDRNIGIAKKCYTVCGLREREGVQEQICDDLAMASDPKYLIELMKVVANKLGKNHLSFGFDDNPVVMLYVQDKRKTIFSVQISRARFEDYGQNRVTYNSVLELETFKLYKATTTFINALVDGTEKLPEDIVMMIRGESLSHAIGL